MSQFDDLGHGSGGGGVDLFGRLEQRIEALAERHRDVQSRAAHLEADLKERDEIIQQLTERLADSRRVRDQVLERLDRLVRRVEDLERAAAVAPPGNGLQAPEASA